VMDIHVWLKRIAFDTNFYQEVVIYYG